MKRELTRRYSGLFEKGGAKKSFQFAQDLYKYGKLTELTSFAVWELFHRLGLFPKENYLKFSHSDSIRLEKENLASPEFDEKVNHFFAGRGLKALRSDHNWKLLFTQNNQEMFGCVYPDDCDLYKSVDGGNSLIFLKRFEEDVKSIFISSQNTVFVCVRGSLYRSSDNGVSFKKTLELGSPVSFFRFNNAMTETPHRTLIGAEYGNIYDDNGWRKLAYLYYSSDDGETWKKSDFLIQRGTNKHVHVVKYSPLLNKVVMADGDNYKKLWLSDSLDGSDAENPSWKSVTKFHIQMGGYTSVVESDGKIYFGTDYQGGTNFIVESTDGRKFTKKVVPDPYRRSPIDNMVLRKGKKGNEIWANLPFSTANTKCLLMYSADHGKSWHRVFEYNRSTHTVWLLSSSNETAEALYFSVEDSQNNTRVVYKLVDC
jgi:photosystem II stability/assembly factor-like uncharacterized protein